MRNYIKNKIFLGRKISQLKFRSFFKKGNHLWEGMIKKVEKLFNNNQNILLIILLILLLFVVLMLGGMSYLQFQIKLPMAGREESKIFVVSPGETVKEIAKNLEKLQLIRNDLYFLIYFKQIDDNNGEVPTIKAGKYMLSSNLNIPQIVQKLIGGLVITDETKILLPEGYNIFQVGIKLEESHLIDLEDFINFSFQNNLEGHLFPDTYNFKNDQSIENIVRKILNNFEQKTKDVYQGLNKEEINAKIILASLLEKEVRNSYDRRVVAGIIEKRIKANMPLQIDASVLYSKVLLLRGSEQIRNFYLQNNKHNPITLQDLEINSVYNTYKNLGLPPGPICSPGIEAIKAALNPSKTDYWYYLNTEDGTTVFSKTYNEHLANKRKYLQ